MYELFFEFIKYKELIYTKFNITIVTSTDCIWKKERKTESLSSKKKFF